MLELLREADDALYRLWRMRPMGDEFSDSVSALQNKFIHPAIDKERINEAIDERLSQRPKARKRLPLPN